MNDIYSSYFDTVFARIERSERVLIRLDKENFTLAKFLQVYCGKRGIQASIVCDDVSLLASNNWETYTYYLYFVTADADNRPLHDVVSYLEKRKDIYDQLKLGVKFEKNKWMITYMPYPMESISLNFLLIESSIYEKLSRRCFPLYAKLVNSQRITIKGYRMRLEFTYDRSSVFFDFGEHNLPDGEIGVIPNIKSTKGSLFFNQVIYHGFAFHNVILYFENGRCISFSCDERFEFEKILYFDNYSPYIGEFSFGLNPYILKKTGVPIVDEKQMGTYHIALGGVNNITEKSEQSFIHLDMISELNMPCEIYTDNEIIFQNGRFVAPTLKRISSEYLTKGDTHDRVQKK